MKLFAYLLITAGLIVGVIGALTAYLPPLSLPDDSLLGLTLNGPAGLDADGAPIARKDEQLSAASLAALRAAGVTRVRVKEFALARWTGGWMFAAGVLGLGLGAAVVRRQIRRDIASGLAAVPGAQDPDQSLAAIRSEIDSLRRDLPSLPGTDARLRAILDRVAQTQQNALAAFITARPILLGRLGIAGFARLMDAFASAERQINRAWSAAADEVEPEALACLDRASILLVEAQNRLTPDPNRRQ